MTNFNNRMVLDRKSELVTAWSLVRPPSHRVDTHTNTCKTGIYLFIYTIFKEVYTFSWNSHSTKWPSITKLYTSKHCFSDFFADDSTIHSSAPSIAKVNKELQADLEIAVAWSKQNKLPINYDKTTYMVLGTKPKEHDTYLLDLSADGNKIEKVPKQKLLGIVIDDHLSWAPHIDYLCSTISSKISLLRHISIYRWYDSVKI